MRANAVCHMLLAPSHADSVSFFVPTPSQCAIRNSPAPPTARQMPKMAGKGKCARRVTKCICEQPACLYHGPLDSWAGVNVVNAGSCLLIQQSASWSRTRRSRSSSIPNGRSHSTRSATSHTGLGFQSVCPLASATSRNRLEQAGYSNIKLFDLHTPKRSLQWRSCA